MRAELIAITQPLHETDFTVEPTNVLDEFLEYCGRVSHRSTPKGDGSFIAARIAEGHESILEHASATFEISGISRVCSHQLVRHRLASYTQESQRYVKGEREDKVAVPEPILENDELMVIYTNAVETSRAAYQQLIDKGVKPEDARYLLPTAEVTRLVMTMNFRELRHFFNVRITEHAQREIRRLAICMLCLIMLYAPSVFGDIYRIKKSFFSSEFQHVERE